MSKTEGGLSLRCGYFMAILLAFFALPAGAETNAYAFPGAIRSIEQGVPSDFPDSPESRNWVVGFSDTLWKVCPDSHPSSAITAAGLLTMMPNTSGGTSLTSYAPVYLEYMATYLGSKDGVADGRVYLQNYRDCSRVIPVLEHAMLVEYRQMLHEPDPDDFRVFLQQMGSEQTRDRYPTSIRTGVWWSDLTQQTWVNDENDIRLEFKSGAGEGKIATLVPNRSVTSENFSGGNIRTTVVSNDHYAVVFHECAANIREIRTEWCRNREKDHFITVTQLADRTLSATLHRWIPFRKQFVETTYHLVREQAEVYTLQHAYPSLFRPHMFDLDMSHLPASQQAQAKLELQAIGDKRQMTIDCVYRPGTLIFWLDTVPANFDALLSVFPDHRLTELGHIAVHECPADYALARQVHGK